MKKNCGPSTYLLRPMLFYVVLLFSPLRHSKFLLVCPAVFLLGLASHISFVGLLLSILINCPYHVRCRSSILENTELKLLTYVVVSYSVHFCHPFYFAQKFYFHGLWITSQTSIKHSTPRAKRQYQSK